jgi:hypothetical protein
MASDDFEAFYLAYYGRLVGQLLTMLGEVARQLRVPAGTVKSRLARGRAALARRLGAAEGEEARRA